MTTNKVLIFIALIISACIIGIPTYQNVVNINNERNMKVVTKKICESAEKCLYEGNCISNKITLEELKTKKYLTDTMVNPITKEVYNLSSYVLINSEGASFYAN